MVLVQSNSLVRNISITVGPYPISSIKGQGTLRNDRGWSQNVTAQCELLLVGSQICHEALDFSVGFKEFYSSPGDVIKSTFA